MLKLYKYTEKKINTKQFCLIFSYIKMLARLSCTFSYILVTKIQYLKYKCSCIIKRNYNFYGIFLKFNFQSHKKLAISDYYFVISIISLRNSWRSKNVFVCSKKAFCKFLLSGRFSVFRKKYACVSIRNDCIIYLFY